MHSATKNPLPPVITIDGLGGVGKGTIAKLLSEHLAWHLLDSGMLYRAIAWAMLQQPDIEQTESFLLNLLNTVKIEIKENPHESNHVLCNGIDISGQIRTEKVSNMASKISAMPIVRKALLELQRQQRKRPGLIADGRDMGTVVFPDAVLKLFLTATTEERAKRRYHQLKAKGINVSLREVCNDLIARDERDSTREIAPAKPASDAVIIDTSTLSIEQVLEKVLIKVQEKEGVF